MAPQPYQVAGALLEEAILAVLAQAGFSPLRDYQDDPTIDPTAAPFTIYGRGTSHQIDAVADPLIGYPFSSPPRLLIEAKAYAQRRHVGLDIVRNAVGTLKDLTEFWRPALGGLQLPRYNYRYAIFSTSDFSLNAQEYAYAQDVYLLPLRRSAFFRPVVNGVDHVRMYFESDENRWPEDRSLSDYRARARHALSVVLPGELGDELEPLVAGVHEVRVGLVAVAARQFPIFLAPRSPDVVDDLADVETVRIYWDQNGWYLRRRGAGENLFSFDVPEHLLRRYAEEGGLRREAALRMKADNLASLQAFHLRDGVPRLIQFQLDGDWIDGLLRRA